MSLPQRLGAPEQHIPLLDPSHQTELLQLYQVRLRRPARRNDRAEKFSGVFIADIEAVEKLFHQRVPGRPRMGGGG